MEEEKIALETQEAGSDKNTGSSDFQISLFTRRIKHLSEHLKKNKKDFNCRMGLIRLVSKRKRLLSYFKRKNFEAYLALIHKLGLRK